MADDAGSLDYGTEQGQTEQGRAEQTPQKGQLDYSTVYGSKEQISQPPEQVPVVLSDVGTMADDELDAVMADEVAILEELDPDGDYSYDPEPTVEIVEATRSLRLLNQGNMVDARELITRTAEDACQRNGNTPDGQKRLSALRMYLSADLNSQEDKDFLTGIVRQILIDRAGV